MNHWLHWKYITNTYWRWYSTQMQCPDLRHVHAHLKQGTRPSKKITKANDVKRYLNHVTIASDGLLVVKSKEPFSTKERIVIPRGVLDVFLEAIHIQLKHPLPSQLKAVCQRYVYALDMDKTISKVKMHCHVCASFSVIGTCTTCLGRAVNVGST